MLETVASVFFMVMAGVLGLFTALVVIVFVASAVTGFVRGRPRA